MSFMNGLPEWPDWNRVRQERVRRMNSGWLRFRMHVEPLVRPLNRRELGWAAAIAFGVAGALLAALIVSLRMR
jgi:hypothetical protein